MVIRRGLLKIIDINNSISTILNKKFLTYKKDISKSEYIFKQNKDIKFIPIIDKSKNLLKSVLLESDQFKDIPVIIMVGGKERC